MERTDLISATEFCTSHSISYSFVSQLQDAGLIQIVTIEEQHYLDPEQLGELEKFTRMHTELDINIEGIEAIANLLQQVSDLQEEMKTLYRKLDFYEGR